MPPPGMPPPGYGMPPPGYMPQQGYYPSGFQPPHGMPGMMPHEGHHGHHDPHNPTGYGMPGMGGAMPHKMLNPSCQNATGLDGTKSKENLAATASAKSVVDQVGTQRRTSLVRNLNKRKTKKIRKKRKKRSTNIIDAYLL